MKKGLILGMALMVAVGGTASASGLKTTENIKQDKVTIMEAKAESLGMTVEELIAQMKEQGKAKYAAFEAKAESMGMTVEELKAQMKEQGKEKYEAFEAKAESMGMTVIEYKKHLAQQKK